MTGVPARPRRWRPRWLTTRTIALGSAFTVAIFAFVLGIAALFAAQAGAASRTGTPTHVATPADHRGAGTPEPND
jgi:hypothetical protein